MLKTGRKPNSLLIYLLAFCQAFWVLGCSQDSIGGKSKNAPSTTLAGILASQDLGTIVFDIYRDDIQTEPQSVSRDSRLGELDSQKVEFVDAVNTIVNASTLQGVSQTTEALFRLVDDGTFPTLTEHLAQTLDTLAADPQALDAVLDLISSRQRNAIPVEELVTLLGRMFNYSETEQLWQAAAQLIRENDGVDDQGLANGEPRLVGDLLSLLSDSLASAGSAGPASSSVSQALDELSRALTEEATIRGTFNFGAPEYAVVLDDRGYPTVAQNPATGQLYPPFVDANTDGLADVNGSGDFVDGAGNALDIPTFGPRSTPGFDSFGRAEIAPTTPIYVYVDAKKTILALFMQVGGELLSRDLLAKGRKVVDAGLGPQRPDGTFERSNPVLELAWGLVDLLESDVAPKMLSAAAELIRTDPALAEKILVALSRGLNAGATVGQQSSFSTTRFSDPRMVQLIDDLLPIVDELFEQPASGQVSTARQLTETMAQVRSIAPNFSAQLAPLVKFVTVERETTPDADRNDIDENRSWPVDRTQPAWIGNTDNRSALHQLLDLIQRADGCSFFGNNLAVMIINLMADLTPNTVGNLVSLLNALPSFVPNLFCSGISADLASLDFLARSGGLDALLPIAKTFKDRGETQLLVNLLVRIQQDYDTTFRPIEADLALFLDSGALESFAEVLDLSRSVTDPVSGESMADLAAEALELLVDDEALVFNARNIQTRSRAYLLIDPLREFDLRVQSAGVTTELDDLMDGLFETFLETVNVSGTEQLRNGSLIPLAAKGLDIFSRALPTDPQQRAADVAQAQADLLDAGSSRDFGAVVDVLRVIDRSPSKALINRGLVNLLTPNVNQANDIFGGLARLAVIMTQAPPSANALQDLAPFLSRVLDPNNPLVPGALKAFERLLTADQGKTILNVLRAAFNPVPGTQFPPATILIHIVQDVEDAGSQGGGVAYDRAALQDDLGSVSAFIRNDVDGLEWVYGLIRGRQVK